jgi:hypothetical protein
MNKKIYDKNRVEITNKEIGDSIYAKLENKLNRGKLDAIYEGPFTITDKSDHTFTIDVNGKSNIVHAKNVRL